MLWCSGYHLAPWCSSYHLSWHHGVVDIATAQLHSAKTNLRFFVGSNPARGMLEIRDDVDL